MTYQTLQTLVQVFTRAPVPGEVKTRLIPALGESGAAALHADLTSGILNRLSASDIEFELWCAGDADHPFFSQFEAGKRQQEGADLGDRMAHALRDGLERASRVLLIGTDLPTLDVPYLEQALESLRSQQVVFGPAMDGGYGAVGVTGQVPDMFTGIRWGSSGVLSATCAKLNEQRIGYSLLPLLWDVDTPEDLPRYYAWLNSAEPDQAFGA